MRRFIKTNRWLIMGVFIYSALHLLAWWAFLNSNGGEAWAPALKVASFVFLPIGVLSFGLCYLVWGTTNLFKARFFLGPVADVAVASVISSAVILILLVFLKDAWRRLVRRGPAR